MKQELRDEASLGPVSGLYSQAIRSGDLLFTTQIGNVRGGPLAGEDMYTQAVQTLKNASAILAAAGGSLADVVKCTIYIVDMADYDALNQAYREWMPKPYPARACVQVSRLSPGSRVEMEFVADISR